MAVVDACLRMVAIYKPAWWALENPVGRLKDWIGPYSWIFDPYEYGGYMALREKTVKDPLFPARDAYTKKTCIWGTAKKPRTKPVPYVRGKRVTTADGSSYLRRGNLAHESGRHRSVTPMGFSRAFKEANP